ncbi:hypothetical protein ccbrp13_60530 [Ktedonobacteria bacterium brp13]|nr:hypothetical protein ccbrp13_60530 [Ktedonobacteria bacterium brp13]
MKKKSLIQSPLRWFLLLWIGMTVAVWLVGNYIQNAVSGSARVAMKPPPSLPLTLLFLLLVALYSFLLWRGLSDLVQPRFFWWYFLVQGLLVVAMQLVGAQPNLTLNFYLALTLCACKFWNSVSGNFDN